MQALVDKYNKSVEDPFDEKDWDAWKTFTKNNDLQIVGDDIRTKKNT